MFTKIDAAKISSAPTFRSGMTACVYCTWCGLVRFYVCKRTRC
ncbi:hypothetical protein OK016_07845 [Vibrio chagasii]|nr:hypothetical protein [Vibrio chagasii]